MLCSGAGRVKALSLQDQQSNRTCNGGHAKGGGEKGKGGKEKENYDSLNLKERVKKGDQQHD